MEYLTLPFAETKAVAERGVFSGHGAAYALDLVGDKIQPGAFRKSIAECAGKVPILKGHDPTKWAGVTSNLSEDAKGLHLEATLFLNTDDGRNAHGLLKDAHAAGYACGLSIGFYTRDFRYDEATGVRTLTDIDLREVSLTAFPANPAARIVSVKTAHSLEGLLTVRLGCSAQAAQAFLKSLRGQV